MLEGKRFQYKLQISTKNRIEKYHDIFFVVEEFFRKVYLPTFDTKFGNNFKLKSCSAYLNN